MSKFRVSVQRTIETIGWVEVEADTAEEAMWAVDVLEGEEIEEIAEWGSCGDTDSYFVDGYVERVVEPSVSDGLWA